ncbi:MAG: hypothetical protein R3B13_16155 [Polyangiaceae bacterium]
MHRTVYFFVLSVLLSACFTAEDTVHARAAHDFDCPEERISVTKVSGSSYSASGCGQTATYSCNGVDSVADDIKCILDRDAPGK